MPLITDLWSAEQPCARTVPTLLEHERDRWAALLAEPRGLFHDSLQFGPLTADGYLDARAHSSMKKDPGWPQDADGISHLMRICGMESYEAKYVAYEHFSFIDIDSNWAVAKVFNIHLALLDLVNVKPTGEVLLEFLDEFDWGDSYFEAYLFAADIMKVYIPTVDEQNAFLQQWLPTLKRSSQAYGLTQSLGSALAASFPEANPEPIIEWCKTNDDQVGLGYLVWQNRLGFDAWLAEVSDPTTSALSRTYNADYPKSLKIRRGEQLETLGMLAARIPAERLEAEGAVFYQNNPELVEGLFGRTETAASADDKMSWIFGLLGAHAIPTNDPFVHTWIERAYAHQEELIQNMATSNRDIPDKSYDVLRHKMHYAWGPQAHLLGPKARDVLARDIVFRMNSESVASYIADMPDKAWLHGTSVATVLLARAQTNARNVNDAMVAFYPFMAAADQKAIAQHLIAVSLREGIKADHVAKTLFSIDPENYMFGMSSSQGAVALMMQLLTKKDPAALFSAMESLEIKPTDASYTTMIMDWVNLNIGNELTVNLPNDVMESFLDVPV